MLRVFFFFLVQGKWNDVALLTEKFSENVMANLKMSSIWGDWKRCFCKMYVILCIFTRFLDWNQCLINSKLIHLDGHRKWLNKKWDGIKKKKRAIFTNILLQINSYLLYKTLHSALFIPHYCKTNGHSRFCSIEWFLRKTIHLYAKRHLYHKMHAIKTLTPTQQNLWSLCTMYFMLNNCCHC